MLRAPTCITSVYFATSGTCSGAITSVTIASPVASRASASSSRPFSFKPLEAVRAGARLEGAAAQAGGAGLAHGMGDFENLLARLDRARPGDDADLAGADFQLEHLDAGRVLLDLGAGHLVRREDRHDLFHAIPRFQGLLGPVAFFAQGGHDGAVGADE